MFLFFLAQPCFGITGTKASFRDRGSAYMQHREEQKSYDRERQQAFQDYKRTHALQMKEKRESLKERVQTLDRRSFEERMAGLKKQWETEQKEYNKNQRRNLQLYHKTRVLRERVKKFSGNPFQLIKGGREFTL